MLYNLSPAERKHRIQKFLTFFGVWDQRNKQMSDLSAGQKTRVMLAKAFLAHPRIALLDEPTASLDPDIAHEVRTFVLEQRREYNVSMLFTSHNMDEVTEVCDRVMFLQHGKIVADDTPDNLARSISTATVQLMVGDGMKRTIEYAKKHKLAHTIENRVMNISLDEQHIAELLSGLAKVGVEYTQISINKPSLETYFLYLAKQGRVVKKENT